MDDNSTPWEYKPDKDRDQGFADGPRHKKHAGSGHHRPGSIEWEAPEYIDHPHGPGWYSALFLSTIALAAVIYISIKDAAASIIITLAGIILGVFAAQKPGEAKYEITSSGLSINGKLYNFGNYKSFAVVREGPLTSVNLLPIKRLMPPLSVYFKPDYEDKIVKVMGDYLPYEDRKLDGVERLARRIRL
jgi:hypothetical protein